MRSYSKVVKVSTVCYVVPTGVQPKYKVDSILYNIIVIKTQGIFKGRWQFMPRHKPVKVS